MLPLKYRLKKRKTFKYIHRNGKRADGLYVTVLHCSSSNLKIGFSASKKVGNSVVRHRALRLMREAVRPFIDRMRHTQNYIFIAKEGIEKNHLLFITLDIENTLKKTGVML